MSVTLDFDRDPDLLRVMSDWPIEVDVYDLEVLDFRQNLRLCIDGQMILDALVPLFLLAFHALEVVESVPANSGTLLEIPGGSLALELRREGDSVSVREKRSERWATASYRELVSAWQECAAEARAYLVQEFPELEHHPQVGPSFRDKN